ncbi:LLM class flavin-dependent oxidoreductase [Serinibacter arcticus]|uniref:LLM class flavin-dependent oxidoreductase n=1 Tax=Serinibacter arcticus TaxID=1655435 RepID=A0A2U1ZV94_9MICO|nr:LLM class flavin-dependent oxidoreductase [Serinibacter arcticus]PWD50917.1 LLM class flavin-dependent oxidoreductase [Serinibacter arcticus]
MTTHPLQLGILSFTSYLEDGVSAQASLEDGIALVQHAEALGLDGAWLRVRHFERALTGVFPYLAALARETSRLRLGTAVVPLAGESPVRLAEDAATVDLLAGGRLELGVSSGILGGNPALADAITTTYGHGPTVDGEPRAAWVLRRFLLGISGEELAPVPDDVRLQFTHAGEGLRIYPHSPRLPERIWCGSGTVASAERAARLGLNLQLSTINTETHAAGVAIQQAETLEAYHAALDTTPLGLADPRPREVSISRYVLPWTSERERTDLLAAAERHIPGVTERFGEGWKVGSVDDVVEQLASDPALVRGQELFPTTLLANLPSQLGPELTQRLVEVLATEVAPQLGWTPAG